MSAAVASDSSQSQTASQATSRPNFHIVRTLGEGAFGEVQLVVDSRNPNCALAMKRMNITKHQAIAKEFRKEALLQKKLSDPGHDNVIRYIGMRGDTALDEFQLFLEYADGGELFDQIEPDVGLPIHRAQFYFRQLLSGVAYIHSHGIAHRDIKPENLLLTKKDVLKISDFGMATVFRHEGRERMLDNSCGTLPYVSPEVLQGRYRAEPSDLWSCGIVLVTMIAGELPWESPRKDSVPYQGWLQSSSLHLNPWKKMDNKALSLLRIILTNKVANRANMERINNHPWTSASVGVSTSGPASKRRKLVEKQNEMEGAVSQPAAIHPMSSYCQSPMNNSFSQPEDVDSLLLSSSQMTDYSQAGNVNQDPLQCLVRRMTRFCVILPVDEVVSRVKDACDQCGFVANEKHAQQVVITYRDISFIVTILEMVEQGIRKVMLDFRRSRGDGLEFKRAFILMKTHLRDIICSEGTQWLESQGLTGSQMGATVY